MNGASAADQPATIEGPGKLFAQMIEQVKFYQDFEIDQVQG